MLSSRRSAEVIRIVPPAAGARAALLLVAVALLCACASTDGVAVRHVRDLAPLELADGPLEVASVPARVATPDLLALDQRGRVQIPKELLEQVELGDRIRAEVTEDGLLLRKYDPYVD